MSLDPPKETRIGADVAAENQEDRHRTLRTNDRAVLGRVRGNQHGGEEERENSRVSQRHESRKGSRLMTYSTWRATVVAAPEETG